MRTTSFAVLAAAVLSTSAFAQFRYDEATGSCRDERGQAGWNVGLRGPCGDLRGQDLTGASFDREDLRGARFDGATLTGASFFRADVRGASFDGARLDRAVFSGARLEGATLRGASLMHAKLVNAALAQADLRQADLRNADLHGAHFTAADLRGARFSAHRALLGGAKWQRARVDGATRLPFAPGELASLGLMAGDVVATHP